MNMQSFRALLLNSFQKEIRGRGLWGFVLLTLAVVLITNLGFDFVSKHLKESGLGLDIATKKMAAFTVVSGMWASFMGMYFGLNALKSDEEAGVLPYLMSFPISRPFYLLSRLLGGLIMSWGLYILSFGMALALFSFSSPDSNSATLTSQLAPAGANLLAILAALIVGALLSFFVSRLQGLIISIFLIPIISTANATIGNNAFQDQWSNLGVIKVLGLALHYLLPRMGTWSSISTAMALDKSLGLNIGLEAIHLVASGCVCVLVMHALFRRKGL